MAFNQAAMQSFADYTVANCNGRTQDLAGNDLNVDQRFGYQCMDLWIWARYRLGFTDNIPTPDAAAVWEMNWTAPTNRMWEFFDAITPEKTAVAGDIGIMNRQFFGNGVGHIFMILADLGASIRVLELNGLGDGFEDAAGGQHGSPARIHDWPKTYLYGYLRWIGSPPAFSGQSTTITPIDTTPIQEDDMSAEDVKNIRGDLNTVHGAIGASEKRIRGDIATVHNTIIRDVGGQLAGLREVIAQLPGGKDIDLAAVEAASKRGAEAAIAEGVVKVDVTIAGGDK